ncbi:Polymerase/histidinol phosphatase-like protein [Pilobolus umbonatus]|nr:Polymerase/histidinol phosphatase-like protein [Pilobolus umbonatus]
METHSQEQNRSQTPSVKQFTSTSLSTDDIPSTSQHNLSKTAKIRLFFKSRKPFFKGVFIRTAVFISILAVLIAIGLGAIYSDHLPRPEDFSRLEFDWKINPKEYLTPFNTSFQDYNVLLDGHSHSTYSDGKMNVRQLLNWHIGKFTRFHSFHAFKSLTYSISFSKSANGYNAVIVSDHNSIRGGLVAEKIALEEYNQSIVVIPAMEYTCCRIHMNFVGINTTFFPVSPAPTDQELQQVINEVHKIGGLVIVNHIPWSNTTESGYQLPRLPNHPSVQQLIDWGVDGFEVMHGSTFDLNTFRITAEKNLIQMVGTDIHHPTSAAETWLTIQSPNMTKEAILNEIRNRRTSFLSDPAGTRPRVYVDYAASYNMLRPLLDMGSYFTMFYSDSKGMYDFQGSFCHPQVFKVHGNLIGWFVFWVVVFIVSFEVVRLGFLWITRKIRHRQWSHRS